MLSSSLRGVIDSGRSGSNAFEKLLANILGLDGFGDFVQDRRGGFHFLTRPIRGYNELHGYLCHESESVLKVGQSAFFIAFAKRGVKIKPDQIADSGSEARLSVTGLIPGFTVYKTFKGEAELALSIFSHLIVAQKLFAHLELNSVHP